MVAGDAAARSGQSTASLRRSSVVTTRICITRRAGHCLFSLPGGWLEHIGRRRDRAPAWRNGSRDAGTGHYEPTIQALELRQTRGTLSLDHPTTLGVFGFEIQSHAELSLFRILGDSRDGYSTFGRASFARNGRSPSVASALWRRRSRRPLTLGMDFRPLRTWYSSAAQLVDPDMISISSRRRAESASG